MPAVPSYNLPPPPPERKQSAFELRPARFKGKKDTQLNDELTRQIKEDADVQKI